MSVANGLVAAWFLLLLLVEQVRPLRRPRHSMRERLAQNVVVSLSAYAVGALVVRPAAAVAVEFALANPFALFALAPSTWGPGRFVLEFLTLDLTFYLWHRLNHRWPFLWRFHRVHHLDPDMDVTTTFRFHPMEILFSVALTLAQVLVLGISSATFLVYGIAFQAATTFHHANFRLPNWALQALAWAFVTPPVHGIHHAAFVDKGSANFSVVFVWWDRLLGTFRQPIPREEITIGVAGFEEPAANRLATLLVDPFRRQEEVP
jgi:sterol desaturase/sphingolipid hydroxylase (fatty acid hydroxylase superfamily)